MKNLQLEHCDFTNSVHCNAFISLMNTYITDDMGGGDPIEGEKQQKLIKDMSNTKNKIVLLAEYDKQYVGLLNAFTSYATFSVGPLINIHDIIVDNHFRGLGIGKFLMLEIEKIAKTLECRKLSLEVREDNKIAQHLYKQLNYSACKPNMLFWVKFI